MQSLLFPFIQKKVTWSKIKYKSYNFFTIFEFNKN